ncbi:MAG: hypothetical protein ABJD97_18780 [Betaproteobacteria bacterium]
MNFNKTPELLCIAITVAVVFSTFSVGAISANAGAPTPAETRYQKDRADCLAGKTAESQKTCLKEAGAALQASREHQLKTPDGAQLAANERKRCQPLSGDDKAACLKRADGMDTSTRGSVAAGGDIKETVTVVPGVQPDPLPATAAGPATQPQPSN